MNKLAATMYDIYESQKHNLNKRSQILKNIYCILQLYKITNSSKTNKCYQESWQWGV